MWNDLRFAFRTFGRSPGFVAVAVLALALGIGANTALFSCVNAILLKALPFADPERVVVLWDRQPQYDNASISAPEFLDWQDHNQVFSNIAAHVASNFNLTGREQPERLRGQIVSTSFFDTLGVQPFLGRGFRKEEPARVAVLSHTLWQQRFGGDPKLVGQSIILNGESTVVIGVMPKDIAYPPQTELWVSPKYRAPEWPPLQKDPSGSPGNHYLRGIARLKPGMTLDRARLELSEQYKLLAAEKRPGQKDHVPGMGALRERLVGQSARTMLLVLFSAVGFVLLIACANIANLLLARASARSREMAIRLALGASRGRLIRQALTESLLLSLAGGAVGLLLGSWSIGPLLSLAPSGFPFAADVKIDPVVLSFTLGVALFTGLLFGLAPAFQSAGLDVNETLKSGGRGVHGGGRGLRNALVVAEIALSMVLLVGAGLMLRTFWNLVHTPVGLDPVNVLTAELSLPRAKYEKPEQRMDFYRRLTERASNLPGVKAAGLTNDLPLSGSNTNGDFAIQGREEEFKNAPIYAEYRMASPGYFTAIGVPLRVGRFFTAQDSAGRPSVAIINETMAKRFWPKESPIGKRLKAYPDLGWMEIVGVVGDLRPQGPQNAPPPEFYMSTGQIAPERMSLAMRTTADPLTMISALRGELRSLDSDLPIYNVRTLEGMLDNNLAGERASGGLLGAFAVVALLLSAIGIYGVMAYAVAQRTNEIGVRMALGASQGNVMGMILGSGGKLALIGIGIGLVASLALTRVVQGVLFGVTPTDPLTFSLAAAGLATVALLACLVPSLRATRVDPVIALRYE
ncbi:MAG: ABC transporter permease [Bryobacteraceae bacterium]